MGRPASSRPVRPVAQPQKRRRVWIVAGIVLLVVSALSLVPLVLRMSIARARAKRSAEYEVKARERYSWVGPLMAGGIEEFVRVAHVTCFDVAYQSTLFAGIFNKDRYRMCLDSHAENVSSEAVLLSNPRLERSADVPDSAVLHYEVDLVRGALPGDVVEATSIYCTGGAGGAHDGSHPFSLKARGAGRFQARTNVSLQLRRDAVPPCRVAVYLRHGDWMLTRGLFAPIESR